MMMNQAEKIGSKSDEHLAELAEMFTAPAAILCAQITWAGST